MKAKIYTDGSYKKDDSKIGFRIECIGGKKYERSVKVNVKNNNEAEFIAVIQAILFAKNNNITDIQICTDSQVVCNFIDGKNKLKNDNLIMLGDKLLSLLNLVKYEIVKIPSGENLADALAR